MLCGIQEVFEKLNDYQDKAQKLSDLELDILSILEFKDLFERLLAGIKEKFEIPHVWVTLIEGCEVHEFVSNCESSDILLKYVTSLHRDEFLACVKNYEKPLLTNQNLAAYAKLFPGHGLFQVRSMAISPIFQIGQIVGSLNFGDLSAERYRPGRDTSLLEHLAIKVSICLTNVTAHEKLRQIASKDPLTGLLNRRVMDAALEREFARTLRCDAPLSLVFLDIDDFKRVNDAYGHDVGDQLLIFLASHFTRVCRNTDIVTRFAGDEFVIILPCTGLEEARSMAERLVKEIVEKPMRLKGKAIPVTVSYGIAESGENGVRDPKSLLKQADEMLYAAKTDARKELCIGSVSA